MKKGDMRRTQILDTAEKLFFERGYERTSIQDILDALNMSKGGFYHYFDAKESVLRDICERRMLNRFERLNMELYVSRRSPMDKLNLLLGLANLFESEDADFAALLLKLCYRDYNPAIRAQRRRILIDRLAPCMGEVIAEGVKDGVFYAPRPLETGRMLLLLALDVDDEACEILAKDTDNPDRVLRMLELLNAYRDGAEILLDAPHGALNFFDVGKLITAWQAATAKITRLEGEKTE